MGGEGLEAVGPGPAELVGCGEGSGFSSGWEGGHRRALSRGDRMALPGLLCAEWMWGKMEAWRPARRQLKEHRER